jgi:O-antigen ligase
METVFLAYIVDAINSLICLLIGCLLAILFYKSRKIKFKRLTLIAFVGFFDILCTVVPLASIMGGEMFFGRDLTFTGRTYIWNLATNLIAQSPIIGHGFMTSDVIAGYLGGYSTPHNEFLLVLMYGGCIALVLFIVGVSFLMRPLDSEANLLSAVLKAVIVSLGIYCIFETVSFNTLLIFPFIYSYHFGQIKNLSTECVDINEEH